MFSWICPQCGKDVPPSKTECPYCAERAREYAAQQAMQPPQAMPQPPIPQGAYGAPVERIPENAFPQRTSFDPPPQQSGFEPSQHGAPAQRPFQTAQAVQPPQQQYPPQPPGMPAPWPGQQYQVAPGQPLPGRPPQWGPPVEKSGPPTWLLSVAFALAILGIGAAIYYGLQRFGKTNPQERAGLENPANPSKSKVSNPLQKYVEVVGIRLMGDSKKRPVARFIVINHSSTEIDGLAANVTLWASTSRSEEDSVAAFNFKLPRLGANESKEMTEALKTKLKLYELPDWQNANADIQITAP